MVLNVLEAPLITIALAIELIGVFLILHGVIYSAYKLLFTELFHKDSKFSKYEHTKRILIQKIIFALDFFVAGDLIRLLFVSAFEDLIKISIIVSIRTVLSWSLSKEIHLHKD